MNQELKNILDPNYPAIDSWIDTIVRMAQAEHNPNEQTYEAYKFLYYKIPINGKTPEKYDNFIARLSKALEYYE
jgi:hypothetical protein